MVEVRRNTIELITYEYENRNMTRRRIRTEYADVATVSGARDVHIDYEPEYDIHRRITEIANVARASYQGSPVGTDQNLAVYTYAYDLAGNRLSHDGTIGSSNKGRDVDYEYDRLHRVTKADYTVPSGVSTVFEYDLLGNRNTVYDTLNSVTYSYAHNEVNEYNKVTTGTTLPGSDNYFYDDRGNLSRDDGFDDDSDDRFGYTYDLENRLTEVGYDDDDTGALTVVAEYRYDAQGRRIEYIDSTNEVTTRYYYDGPNVILETNQSDAVQRAYMHGTQYIDERAVMRSYDVGPEDHYYLLEELYTVAGLADPNGGLAEAVAYDTYGGARIYEWPVGDLDRDGDVDTTDESIMSSAEGSPTDYPFADLDQDGDVDEDDENLMTVTGSGTDRTVELTYSGLENPYFFTGRTTDTLHADAEEVANDPDGFRRIQDNRNRTYDPKHGRWLQRDPLGVTVDAPLGKIKPYREYTDGMDLYEYVGSAPGVAGDPLGKHIYITPGLPNPFRDSKTGRFRSRADFRKQCAVTGGRKTCPPRHPVTNVLIQQAMEYIAKYGYYKYLDTAGTVLGEGKAMALCKELQQKDAEGKGCGLGPDKYFTAWQTAGGIVPPGKTEPTRERIVGVYHVYLIPVRSDNVCYAKAGHYELRTLWTGPWYWPWEETVLWVEDLKLGDCPLHTRSCDCCPK